MSTMMIFKVGSKLSGEAQISYIRGLQSRVDLASVQGSSPLYTGWAKKVDHRLVTIILSNLNRFNFFSLKDSLVNLQLNGYYKSHRTLRMLLHYLVKH